jgi:hypothetical protein
MRVLKRRRSRHYVLPKIESHPLQLLVDENGMVLPLLILTTLCLCGLAG